MKKKSGLYIIVDGPPGPDTHFVEVEDQDGRSVGMNKSGGFHQCIDVDGCPNGFYELGPFEYTGKKDGESE